VVCLFLFLTGILFCTGAGLYFLCLFDHFVPLVLLFVIGFSETLVMSFYYGGFTFVQNFRLATGRNIGNGWAWLWKILPIVMLVLLGMAIYVEVIHPFDMISKPLPFWALVLGWCLATFPPLVIPLYGLIPVFQSQMYGEEEARLVTDERYQGL